MKKYFYVFLALLMVLFVPAYAAEEVLSQTIILDGRAMVTDIRTVNIDGRSYFMLRDIAFLLKDTPARFDVSWDATANAIQITTNRKYMGSTCSNALQGVVMPSAAVVYVDGSQIFLTSYNINGRTYFMLDDLADVLGFESSLNAAESASVINTQGVVSVAGSGDRGYVSGEANMARFLLPQGVVVAGDDIIVFDTHNNAIRKISVGDAFPGGILNFNVSTVAGQKIDLDDHRFPQGGFADGNLSSALMNRPTSGVVTSSGDIIFADSVNNALRVIRGNVIETLETDGLNRPTAIAIDASDNLYVTDAYRILRISSEDHSVTVLAGVEGEYGYRDGAAEQAFFRSPSGIAVTPDGSVVYVADTGNHRIRKIENGVVTTIAGTTTATDDDGDPLGGFANGDAASAMFNSPMGIALVNDWIIIADSANSLIRVLAHNNVTTLAGTGNPGDRDGIPTHAEFNSPSGVFHRNGILYIVDTNNNKIKILDISPKG
jgi:DNA-binding beta-propeller fold protein YncE